MFEDSNDHLSLNAIELLAVVGLLKAFDKVPHKKILNEIKKSRNTELYENYTNKSLIGCAACSK